MAAGLISIFIYNAPEVLNIILILAASAKRLQEDQAFRRNNAETTPFPFNLHSTFPRLPYIRRHNQQVQNEGAALAHHTVFFELFV